VRPDEHEALDRQGRGGHHRGRRLPLEGGGDDQPDRADEFEDAEGHPGFPPQRTKGRDLLGKGHIYIDIEDKNNVAVVDAKTMQVTAHYDLDNNKTPAGLALDAKNQILFVACRNPAVSVIMNAQNGKIITTLPIGTGVDGAGFNPETMEAFSSQGDGTLTVIEEKSP
jgi:hypothetical protein